MPKCFLKRFISFYSLQDIRNFLLKIFKKIDDYDKGRTKQNINNNLLFISFLDDGVYLNDVKIIDKRAVLQITILKILLEKHILGNLYSISTGLTSHKISSILITKGVSSFDLEKQIRQSIYRIKKNVSKNYDIEIGARFIQSSQVSNAYKLDKNIRLI